MKFRKTDKVKLTEKGAFYCEHSDCNDRANLNATREFDSGDGDLTWRCEKHTPARFKRKPKALAKIRDLEKEATGLKIAYGQERDLKEQALASARDFKARAERAERENERLAGVIVRTEERAADAVLMAPSQMELDLAIADRDRFSTELKQARRKLEEGEVRIRFLTENRNKDLNRIADMQRTIDSLREQLARPEVPYVFEAKTKELQDRIERMAKQEAYSREQLDKAYKGLSAEQIKNMDLQRQLDLIHTTEVLHDSAVDVARRLAALEGRVEAMHQVNGPKINWLLKAVGSLRGTIVGGAIPSGPFFTI